MIAKITAAFAAFGGLTAIGTFLDYYTRRNLRQVLDWMTTWWIHFDNAKPRDFGKREAVLAIRVFDPLAGKHFWSKERLRVTLRFGSVVLALSVLIVLLFTLFLSVRDHHFSRFRWVWAFDAGVPRTLVDCTISLVGFALSLSVLRATAIVVVRLAPKGMLGFLTFVGLVGFHLFLAYYWTTVVELFESWISEMIHTVIGITDDELPPLTWERAYYTLTNPRPPWDTHLFQKEAFMSAWERVTVAFTAMTNTAANLFRLAFSLVFVASYVAGHIVHEPISRVWEGLILDGKPVFKVIFGALGAIIAAVLALIV